jgi:hypothetical protein
MTMSENFANSSNRSFSNPSAFDVFWLSEGSAATIESLYIQQYYGINYFEQGFAGNITENVLSSPSNHESYNYEDINGSNAVFLNLALVKELKANGVSTESAFKLILKDYWLTNSNNLNWKTKFQEVFGFSVNTFYLNLADYSADLSTLYLPIDITLQNIFKSE